MSDLETKAKNFDNFMKDFHAYVEPYAKSKGWFTIWNEINFVPKHHSNNADYHGHNPIQVTICLALDCKDWSEVCEKVGAIRIEAFGKETNL